MLLIIFHILDIILYMDISKNIISIRESKGIKQSEIAQMLDIEQSNYSRLEKRGSKLTLEQIEKIADALNVTVSEILGITTDLKNTSKEVEQLRKRNEELEDRIKDKNYKILALEQFVDSIKENVMSSLSAILINVGAKNNLIKVRIYDFKTKKVTEELQYKELFQNAERLIVNGQRQYSVFIEESYYEKICELISNDKEIYFVFDQLRGFMDKKAEFKDWIKSVIEYVNNGEMLTI